MADLLMADPSYIGNVFIIIAVGIGAAILLMILMRMVAALGGGEE